MNLCSRFCQVGLLALLATAAGAQPGPTNDLFADRIFLTGTNVTVQGNNSGAGTEPGEDAGSGNILWFYSVWYSWTSPTNGVLHLAGSNSVYNFYMSVRVY